MAKKKTTAPVRKTKRPEKKRIKKELQPLYGELVKQRERIAQVCAPNMMLSNLRNYPTGWIWRPHPMNGNFPLSLTGITKKS